MEQSQFDSIQKRFKSFLTEKKSPAPKKKVIVEQVDTPPLMELKEMEQTNVFGKDDAPIGYRIVAKDKNGKQTYRIVAPS